MIRHGNPWQRSAILIVSRSTGAVDMIDFTLLGSEIYDIIKLPAGFVAARTFTDPTRRRFDSLCEAQARLGEEVRTLRRTGDGQRRTERTSADRLVPSGGKNDGSDAGLGPGIQVHRHRPRLRQHGSGRSGVRPARMGKRPSDLPQCAQASQTESHY